MSETISGATEPTISAQSDQPIARATVHGRLEITLPDELLERKDGALRRHPMAGSYIKGANARASGRPIEQCPYPPSEDADWWRKGWESVAGGG